MGYPDFYWSFYSGEKEVPGVFLVGIAFFFLLVILGTGISGLDLEPTNDTHQPLNRPFGLSCVFPAFFLSSTKSRFHRGLLVYGVDDFTVYVDKKKRT